MRVRRLIAVALAVVAMAGACGGDDDDGGGSASDATAAADDTDGAGGDEVTIADFAFTPAELEVALGTEVTVTNDDSAAHTWTSSDNAWDSGELDQGASFSHTFDEAGTFPYVCRIHPSMRGTVTVS